MSMDDPNAPNQPQNEPIVQRGVNTSDMMGAGASNANLIYILYLVSIIVGITSLIGVILAYINRDKAPDWVKSHYTFQIHTFWKGIVFGIVGIITLPLLGLGILVIIAMLIWYIIRCVKGMQYLSAGKPVPDPTTWALG